MDKSEDTDENVKREKKKEVKNKKNSSGKAIQDKESLMMT